MPQRLHRLEVRNKLLRISSRLEREYGIVIPANHIVSREAGYIDVYLRSESADSREITKGFIIDALSREGIGIECIDTSYERRRRLWRMRFQNDLMAQQVQWGARGMSRNYRVRNGIDAYATPTDVEQVRSGTVRTIHRANANELLIQEEAMSRRAMERVAAMFVGDMEPLTEEVQDEPDSGILARVTVASVALEESELG